MFLEMIRIIRNLCSDGDEIAFKLAKLFDVRIEGSFKYEE
jgi:hypothetical protein